MVEAVSALLNCYGMLVAVDPDFCQIMRALPDRLIGMSMLAITAIGDRDRCAEQFATLRDTGEPIRTTQRLVRSDGSHLWVHNEVCRVADTEAGEPRYAARITPGATPAGSIDPARMLELARMMRLSRQTRATLFDPAVFADPAWDIVMAAYVAEAEGGLLTLDDLCGSAGLGPASADRWVRALVAERLIERDPDTGEDDAAIRLSTIGYARFERYLQSFYTAAVAVADAQIA